MSRPRPAEGPTVSLFPFLAVLLCTMGSLLVLLVLFSRSARDADRIVDEAAVRRRQEELTLARDELAWRLEQLRDVRERTAADLARERLRLAGAEDHSRRLADELADLERVAAALAAEVTGDRSADDEEKLAARLASAKESLDKARKDAAAKPPAYAVVPYEGVHGTHRRPLYIECSLDGVYLQPEGIRLGPADFEGPPGPGKPLASGLRAAREHLATHTGDSGDPAAQPYPLLLVRPSGVMAYYAARESIQSWGSEFGYQFIDEDWTLQFPPADPLLAQAEQRAVDESRRRIAWLGEVRRQRPARPTQQFRAATTRGGVVAAGGPSVLGDRSRFDWTEEQAAQAAGAAPGRGFSPQGRSSRQSADGSTLAGAGADPLRGRPGGNAAGGGDGLGGQGTGGAADAGSGVPPGGQAPGGQGENGHGGRYAGPSRFYSGAAEGGPDAAGGQTAAADGTAAERSDPTAGNARGGNGPSGSSGTAASMTAAGAGTGADVAGATGGASSGQSSQSAGTGGGGGSMQGPAGLGASAASASAGGASGGSATMSLAGQRGSNWASLASADRPVPLRRPIRVVCTAQDLQLLDDGGRRIEARIPCPGATVFAVDPLVAAIHAKVAGWGIAGDRMYWKPELILSAAVEGEGRREELERLLADSGLDTRRSEPRNRFEKLPPVERTGALGLQR
ncbi:MAG: hypothetical protein ACK6CT_05350 [Planctomycetia bacterium]